MVFKIWYIILCVNLLLFHQLANISSLGKFRDGCFMQINCSGDAISAENANWSFSGYVSKKFDQHVSKSVPLYHEGHDLICRLSDFFLNDQSICYDLGCSTAALTKKLANHNERKSVRFIAVDNTAEMIGEAQKRCMKVPNISLVNADLCDLEFEKSDFIIAYYTLQFVKPKHRQMIYNRIYEALNWGGALVLFEKVRAPDARFQDIMSSLYVDYKLCQGYAPQEVLAKSRSLKGVLEPFSSQANRDFLARAGFVDVMTVMKYVSFEGFLAIK